MRLKKSARKLGVRIYTHTHTVARNYEKNALLFLSSSCRVGECCQRLLVLLVLLLRRRFNNNDDDKICVDVGEEKSISTSTFQNYGYSFGVIGGGTPSEITPIDDFMDKNEKPKAKPMKRAATAQGTAQTEATDNRIGRGSANTSQGETEGRKSRADALAGHFKAREGEEQRYRR